MSTPNRIKQAVLALAMLFLGTGSLASHVLAANEYECGSYGAGGYNLNCPATTTTTNNSSGSAGSGFATVGGSEKILLNDFQEYLSDDGKDLALKVGQIIYFNVVIDGVEQEHSVTVKEIGDDYVILTFASTPFDLRFDLGQTRTVDVTGDNKEDIEVKLNSIKDGLAYLTFRQYSADAQPIPEKVITRGIGAAETEPSGSLWKTVGIVAAIVLILLGLWLAISTWRKRRSNNDIIHP